MFPSKSTAEKGERERLESGGEGEGEKGRMEKLQQALSSLQTTTERREEMEKQLRQKLERELESYKTEQRVRQTFVFFYL
jgi:hypothetical protein